MFGHLWVHLGEPFAHRLVKAITQAHARPLETPRCEPVHARVGETHDRTLQDSHQRPVVHRVLGQPEQRQHVLDLLAVEEARASARDVRDSLAAQLVLELAGQHADRVREDRDLAKCATAHVQAANRLRYRAGLGPGVGRHHDADRRTIAASACRDELRLAGEFPIAPDEVGRAVEDSLERAAVVRQREAGARKTRPDVFDLGIAPPVDGLLRVTDHGHVAEVLGGREPDEIELDAVGVLELVDDQVPEPLAAPAAKLRHPLERVDDLEQEVVEVAQPLHMKAILVRAVDREQHLDRFRLGARGIRASRTIGVGPAAPVVRVQLDRAVVEVLGADAAALELEEKAKSGAQEVVEVVHRQRRERIRVERRRRAAAQPREQLLLEQALTRLVEHTHLARRADQVGELIEQPRADAVKGPDPRSIEGVGAEVGPAGGQLRRDPPAQFLGGPIAEGHREDPVGSDALLDQPAEPLRGGEGLARSGTGRY